MRTEKKSIVSAVSELIEGGSMLILADHAGLSSNAMTELRALLRKNGSRIMVVKNRLLRRALDPAAAEGLAALLHGPTAIAVTSGDSAAFSRIVVEFAKKHNAPRVKAGLLDGALITDLQVGALAALPPRPALVAIFLGGVKAPISGFVRGLSEIVRQFVSVLDQVARSRAPK